jgi:diadenosine tetraphosphate (Ap4A) HIT family hydrolase
VNSPFHTIPREEWLFETSHFFGVADKFPVAPGHLLIVSKAPWADYRDLPPDAKADLPYAIDLAIAHATAEHVAEGYNIGMNCGAAAGQTVFHFHCHVIPRFSGDVEDPRGGVRHAVIGRGYY